MDYETLTQALETHAKGEAGVTFLDSNSGQQALAYRSLYSRALRVLHYFQDHGARAGDELVLCVANNAVLVDALWACLLGGMVPVPLAPGNTKEHRRKVLNVLSTLRKPRLFTERKHLARLVAYANENDGTTLLDKAHPLVAEDITAEARAGVVHYSHADDVALIQFSSGSTGLPKGSVLTHRKILANIQAMRIAANVSRNDVYLNWMPLTHDMGMVGFHLSPLVLGADQYHLPTESFVRRPLGWLEKASEIGATVMASPNFGYWYCLRALSRDGRQDFNLSHVRLIFNGAEPISPRLCREFETALEAYGLRANAIYPVYGLAEATLAVTFPAPDKELAVIHAARDALGIGNVIQAQSEWTDRTLALTGVGRPVPGCEVRITDESNAALPDRHVGCIQIRGDSVTAGYYGASGHVVDGFLDRGWFDTGDLGFWSDGLYVVGRSKDTIILNGQNIHSHDLERLCEAVDGVELGKVACVGVRRDDSPTDDVAVFVQHRALLDEFVPIAQGIQAALHESAGLDVSEIVPVSSIPRTTSGKIQRFELRASFARGEYEEVLAALREKMASTVGTQRRALSATECSLKEICESVIKDRDVGIEDSLIDGTADSMELAEIQISIDTLFPNVIQIEDFLEYPTIASLAAFIESKIAVPTRRARA